MFRVGNTPAPALPHSSRGSTPARVGKTAPCNWRPLRTIMAVVRPVAERRGAVVEQQRMRIVLFGSLHTLMRAHRFGDSVTKVASRVLRADWW